MPNVTWLGGWKTNVRMFWRPKGVVIALIAWTCQKLLLIWVSKGRTLVTDIERAIHISGSSMPISRHICCQLNLLHLHVTIESCVLDGLLDNLVRVNFAYIRIWNTQITMTFGI